MNYNTETILKIAKRLNNTKRSFLLVNPLQAKHIPVRPEKALEMMRTFGKMLSEKYPETKLIIGFAETATAIGAAACESFADDCVYIHTTRENFVGEFLYFSEEHSHAVEQKLYAEALEERIRATDCIIFVDDEISTGKTLINIAECLKKQFPSACGKQFIAASLINRVSEDNEKRLNNAGISCECLLKLPCGDFEKEVENIEVHEAEEILPQKFEEFTFLRCSLGIPNARKGVKIGDYKREVADFMQSAVKSLNLPENADLLVLGTEECMYPALIFGEIAEKQFGARVLCHATTRSPIGINGAENYPIKSGYKLHSFYESERQTFIYNLERHDYAVIVSDAAADFSDGIKDLCTALSEKSCDKIYFLSVDLKEEKCTSNY